MIMPLANRQDKYTQVLWGIEDFKKRFGRYPEGIWLPETACDTETLEVLAEFGIKFTILAPRQAKRARKIKSGARWFDVSDGKIDPSTAYLCRLPSGKTISIFFYDGPISQDLAFGGLLVNGETFAQRLVSAFNESRQWNQIVHIATDGETYGHHQKFGDMALAYCLHLIESQSLANITNYAEYLAKNPPTHQVEIFDNSSWSCIHGIERWRENCGCNTGRFSGALQAWRKPLREGMDWLRDFLIPLYEERARNYLKDPWNARNEYIHVILDRNKDNVEQFFRENALRELSFEEKKDVLKLLEIQRNAMLMYTSCGWFFDEISGLETTQVMRYAARVIQLAEEIFDVSVEKEYLQFLEKAPSNIPEFENGAKVYEMFVKPSMLDLLRVGAHYSISSLFKEYPQSTQILCYQAENEFYEKTEAGKLKLVVGKTKIKSEITWDEDLFSFAVLHLGDHNVNGGIRKFIGDESFSSMHREIRESFDKGDIPEVIRLMDRHFETNNYSLWHLFKDEQRKILHQVVSPVFESVEMSFRKIYEDNYSLMNFFRSLQIPLPKPLAVTAEYVINKDLKRIFENELDIEKLESLIKELKKWSIEIDKAIITFVSTSWLNSFLEKIKQQPEEISYIEKVEKILSLLKSLNIEPDIWKLQKEILFIGKNISSLMKERALKGDDFANRWIEVFQALCNYLKVKIQ